MRVWQRRQMIAGEHRNYKARQKRGRYSRDADDVIHEVEGATLGVEITKYSARGWTWLV